MIYRQQPSKSAAASVFAVTFSTRQLDSPSHNNSTISFSSTAPVFSDQLTGYQQTYLGDPFATSRLRHP